jgi:hypothetical protein
MVPAESQAMAILLRSPPIPAAGNGMQLLGSPPIPAAGNGMQGARRDSPSPLGVLTTQLLFPLPRSAMPPPSVTNSPNGSSEILDPDQIASPPNNDSVNLPAPQELAAQVKSIQLFGSTITPRLARQVNGALDENVGQD